MLRETAANRVTLRAFFALWPDATVRAALAPLVRDIARKVHGRPTAVESIHLTLAFLGEVAEERCPRSRRSARRCRMRLRI
jgi:2'-5' RNA ligase